MSIFDSTLICGTSTCTIHDKDINTADINFEGSLQHCESTKCTPTN